MAKKLRVYELAKHYGVDSPMIMGLLRQMRSEAKSHMSVVEDDAVDKIHARFQRERERARINYARDHGMDPEKLKHVASLRELPRPQPTPDKPPEPKSTKKAPAKKAAAKSRVVVIKKAGTVTAVAKAKAAARAKAEAAEAASKGTAPTEEPRPVRKLVRKFVAAASAPAAPESAESLAPAASATAPADGVAVERAIPPGGETSVAAPAPAAEAAPVAPADGTVAGPEIWDSGAPAVAETSRAPVDEAAAVPTAPPASEGAAPAPAVAPPLPAAPPPRRGAKIIRLGGPVGAPRATPARPGAALPPDYSDLLPPVPEAGQDEAGLKTGVKDSVKESIKAALKRRREERSAATAEAELRRKRTRHRRKKVDEVEVAKNVKQTLAQLESGPAHRRHARKGGQIEAPEEEEATILRVTEFITIQELAEKLEVQPREIIAKLLGLGVMATINQRLAKDNIELIAAEFGSTVEFLGEIGEEILEEQIPDEDLVGRPPVVTVMGHVDHGKTSLLDCIRRTNVVAGEAGGITQHIGAYTVDTPGGPITFLDTPGHQAFTAMRARGAQVTDIVILVVAADDRVMPQTIEAINHAKAAGVPIIVAINKIDLPGARPDLVKQDLMQHGIVVEDFGGQVLSAEIAAKKGINVEKLLELVHLQAEVLELTASPKGAARGVVIEASKEPGRGVMFTVLIDKGTLRVGDHFLVGMQDGKVRALFDERGDTVVEVHPGEPVVVLGANDVPEAGDRFYVLESERDVRDIASRRRSLQRQQHIARPKRQVDLENLAALISAEDLKELPIIVKGDVAGSVEALCDQLMQLNTAEVQVRVIHKAVGAVNESDVLLGANTGAMIIGFHLRPGAPIRDRAKREGVTIEVFDIIYEAVDTLKKAMAGLLGTIQREVSTGSAEVRQVFHIPKTGAVAGAYVTQGTITRNSRGRLIRDEVVIFEGRITSLKRFKEDAREVTNGFECGIGLENCQDLAVGDLIETFRIEEIVRTEL